MIFVAVRNSADKIINKYLTQDHNKKQEIMYSSNLL